LTIVRYIYDSLFGLNIYAYNILTEIQKRLPAYLQG